MATYNTGNPLGSTDPRDLYDNSQGLDKAVNDTEGDTWTDRFGVVRPTIQKALNDLAVSAGLAYETLEELQAVTGTQGQIAEVTNDGENTGRYWWNNGAWEMMSPGALAEIEETNKRLLEVSRAAGLEQEVDDFAYAMGDENDKFGYGLKHSGNIAVNNIEMESAGNDAGTTGIVDEDDKLAVEINESGQTGVSALYFFPMAGENFRIVDDEEKNAYILDDDGNSLFSLSHDRIEYFRILSTVGLLTQRGLSLPENGSVFLQDNASLTADRYLSDVSGELRPYLQRTDIVDGSYIYESRKIRYHLSAGQSLAVGGGAGNLPPGKEVFNPEPPNPQFCLMFNTGLRGTNTPDGQPVENSTDFVSAKEVFSGTAQGETQGCGFMSWAFRNGITHNRETVTRLFRAGGRGNTSIDLLDKAGGGQTYIDNVADLAKAVEIAAKYGKEIEVRSITWTQGENDRNTKTVEGYKAQMTQLASDYIADFTALLPTDNPTIIFITDQLSAGGNTGAGNVSIAQLEAANESPFIYLSTPKYMFPMTDVFHLQPQSYALLGEYNSKVEHYICDLGEEWSPLQPVSIVRVENKITIDFHVPRGGIVIDTVSLPKANNLGFEYGDDANSAVIVDVEQTSSRRIVLTLDKVPTGANKQVRYAYTNQAILTGVRSGSWGNIRDEDYTPSYQVPGYFLTNWCVTFNQSIT